MSKPRLLDLFCGAGGAARGYQMAGFYVVGVDNRPQCGIMFAHGFAQESLDRLRRLWQGTLGSAAEWQTTERTLSPLRRNTRCPEKARPAYGSASVKLARRATDTSQRVRNDYFGTGRSSGRNVDSQTAPSSLRTPISHGSLFGTTPSSLRTGAPQEWCEGRQPSRELGTNVGVGSFIVAPRGDSLATSACQ